MRNVFYQERQAPVLGNEEGEMCDAEILDELTTSRGELKFRTVSFRKRMLLQVCSNGAVQPE
ncbi:boron transporter 4-like [Populus alba x Populus x berolinensis]|nr:boron transporter 4-like [Populus alba x Populus x berolinensis]